MSRRRNGRLRPLAGDDFMRVDPVPEVKQPEPQIRTKREKVRPDLPYSLINGVPVSEEVPDFSLLRNPLTLNDSKSVAHAIHSSRLNWLSGCMFETYWTRKVRGKKLPAEYANREKMIKACECAIETGPHTFKAKLFIVRDDNNSDDEEEESKKTPAAPEDPKRSENDSGRPDSNKSELREQPPPAQKDETGKSNESSKIADREKSEDSSKTDDGHASDGNNEVKTVNTTDQTPKSSEVQSKSPATESNKDREQSTDGQESDVKVKATSSDKDNSKSEVDTSNSETKKESNEEITTEADTKAADESTVEAESTREDASKQSSTEPKPEGDKSETPVTKEAENPTADASITEKEPVSPEPPAKDTSTTSQTPATGSTQTTTPSTTTASAPTVPAVPTAPAATTAPTAPTSAAAPSSAPRPPSKDDASSNSNQMVVYRLQQMAQDNRELADLMRLVATGKAPKEEISKFQAYISKAKAINAKSPMVIPPPSPPAKAPPKIAGPSIPKPLPKPIPRPPQPVIYRPPPPPPPPPPPKASLLVAEFEENSNERFLLPKKSIIEKLPNGDVLWSFIHVPIRKPSLDEDDDKDKSQDPVSDLDNLVWTPLTIKLCGVPPRVASSFARCVSRPSRTVEYMKDIMERGTRSDNYYVWTQIDKTDSMTLDEIKRSVAPAIAPPLPPKRFSRKRQAKEDVIEIEREGPRDILPPPLPAAVDEKPLKRKAISEKPENIKRPPLEKKPKMPKAPKPPKPPTQHHPRPLKYPLRASLLLNTEPSGTPVVERPRLNLPDLSEFKLPPGAELPPLPPSLQGLFKPAAPAPSNSSGSSTSSASSGPLQPSGTESRGLSASNAVSTAANGDQAPNTNTSLEVKRETTEKSVERPQ